MSSHVWGQFGTYSNLSVWLTQHMSPVGVFEMIAVLGMMFGGVAVFIPQYFTIVTSRNSEGFSTHTCLLLLLSNIARLFFWYLVHFELPLLCQSIIVIVGMLFLQEVCVRYRPKRHLAYRDIRLSDCDPDSFWKWSYFSDYIGFLFLYCCLLYVITELFKDSVFYVEALGFAALCGEASLALPQLITNYQRRSTKGLNFVTICLMLCGDCFKTLYFLVRHAPRQFYICSTLQVSIDIGILLQFALYSSSRTSSFDDKDLKVVF